MIITSTLRDLLSKGRLIEAFIFRDGQPEFVYLTPTSPHLPPYANSLTDAAEALHQSHLHYYENKVNTLKLNFQQLPWYARWYYAILHVFFWLPLLPKEHRTQFLNTERQLSRLLDEQTAPRERFLEQCGEAYIPTDMNSQVKHYETLEIGSEVFFMDPSRLFEQGSLYYWQDTITGWIVKKPLFDTDVDWFIEHITQSGYTLTCDENGQLHVDGKGMVFLSEDSMRQYVKTTFDTLRFMKMQSAKQFTEPPN